MNKFCSGCGAQLKAGAKFCSGCGAAVSPGQAASATPAAPGPVQNHETVEPAMSAAGPGTGEELAGSATGELLKHNLARSSAATVERLYARPGEITMPTVMAQGRGGNFDDGVYAVLKDGVGSLLGAMKRTLADKKRLGVVIALTAIWLLVNVMLSVGLFPFPVRLLAWLTSASGGLLGGSVAKGLLAAALAQLALGRGLLGKVRSGVQQMTGAFAELKTNGVPLAVGAGAALVSCNAMVASRPTNIVVCLAAFSLAASALGRYGFLWRLVRSMLPKASEKHVSAVMSGWASGFAIFAAVSFLPGARLGYWLGMLFIAAAVGLAVSGRTREGAVTG